MDATFQKKFQFEDEHNYSDEKSNTGNPRIWWNSQIPKY